MVCRNCGLQNPTGFAFCGSCGQELEGGEFSDGASAAGSAAASAQASMAALPARARTAMRSRAQAVPVEPRQARDQTPEEPRRRQVVCRNCGRANAASRSVCYQCGRRLVLPADMRLQRARQRSGGTARVTTIASAAVLVLLALGAGSALFGAVLLGAVPPPTATPLAIVASPSPTPIAPPTVSVIATPTTVPATSAPTPAPATAVPVATVAPSPTVAPATASPAPAGCAGSEVETAWLNLTRDNGRERVPEGTAWCAHRAVFVNYFGYGTIRLLVNDDEVAAVEQGRSSGQTEYPVTFAEPVLIEPGARVVYQYRCRAAECAATIQVGYDALTAP